MRGEKREEKHLVSQKARGREVLASFQLYYLADELGPDNIRVNMVIPSWTWGLPVQRFVQGKAKAESRSEEGVRKLSP